MGQCKSICMVPTLYKGSTQYANCILNEGHEGKHESSEAYGMKWAKGFELHVLATQEPGESAGSLSDPVAPAELQGQERDAALADNRRTLAQWRKWAAGASIVRVADSGKEGTKK